MSQPFTPAQIVVRIIFGMAVNVLQEDSEAQLVARAPMKLGEDVIKDFIRKLLMVIKRILTTIKPGVIA